MDREHQYTRDRLLEAASRLFAERGYDGVSVRDITKAARANLGAVTYHFGSKDELFAAVVAEKTAPLVEMGREIVNSDDDPEQKLAAMLRVFAVQVLHENPELKVFFVEALCGGKRLPRAAVDGIRWRNKVFGTILKQGIEQGIFRRCNPEHAAWHFFGMLSAYILLQPMMPGVCPNGAYPLDFVENAVNDALDVFFNGLRTPKRILPR